MDPSLEKPKDIYTIAEELTKRIEALEKALRENVISTLKVDSSATKAVVEQKQDQSAPQQEGTQTENSETTETDLLKKHVESRKEVWKEDGKKTWVPDGEENSETEDFQPSGKQRFRYDTPDRGRPTFTVFKSAALFDTLTKLCPSAHEGQVRTYDDRLEILGAYPLLNCRDELLAMRDTATDENIKIELEVMRQLYERKPHFINIKKRQDELLKKQKIDYEGLGGLFYKGQLVVFRELRDEWAVARLHSFSVYDDDYGFRDNNNMLLECEAIDFDGKNFRNHMYRKLIERFVGTKNITELEVYPLSYHPDKEALVEISIASGQRWRELHERLITPSEQPKSEVMQYVGYCEKFSEDPDIPGPGREIAGRVIVDPTRFPDRNITFTENNIDPFRSEMFDGKPEDNPLVLCPEKVLVYSLSDNEWYYVAMRKLADPTWIQGAWGRLVKPHSKSTAAKSIERIRLLAEAHSSANRNRQPDANPNNFRGKGKGLTFLLHGPPGVGKTMLAECLSEEQQKPLYRVNLGMLVADDQWESEIEEIFRQAHFWGAILLIDEAEVVMSERTPESMHSLAWVAVFLRKIEYFEGLLFLTTNQIHMIDPAFISRVNLGMAFPGLDSDTRLKIWQKILGDPDGSDDAYWLLKDRQTLDEWATRPLNGRQIRNVVYSARLLAQSSESQLKKEHIEDCLRDVMNFMDMIKEEKKTIEMNYMSHWS
ncbi:P-loop containing nucleoside triphosphate hydrolase protein [Annulohypoxylon moriforme]|nr:P-loop containing nucleoside triphosphate hydrolase protein [Annulohypoxylon moriforme]